MNGKPGAAIPELAVIGMGCLFPEADSPEAFWQLLIEGRDVSYPAGLAELGVDPAFFADPARGTPDKLAYLKHAYVPHTTVAAGDVLLEPEFLQGLDQLYHWYLFSAAQALRQAGFAAGDKALLRCGAVVGNLTSVTPHSKQLFLPVYEALTEPVARRLPGGRRFRYPACREQEPISPINGVAAALPARLLADGFNLGGPALTFEAACASPLYAVKLAAYYLAAGAADIMLVGAACRTDRLNACHVFNLIHAFPHEGECLPFDLSTGGMKFGEGAGFLVLKRLSDAICDGDRIHAVIESVGLSNDAGGAHLVSPYREGQVLAYQRAYDGAAGPVDYIETHGTGTVLGDRVELDALEKFFDPTQRVPFLGGNKKNIGHLLTAAGMASMIKVILAMAHDTLPPTIGIEEPICSKNGRVGSDQLVRETRPWPAHSLDKRVGVNGFGFGGINGHLVMRSFRAGVLVAPRPMAIPRAAPLAVVGMAAAFGDIEDLLQFDRVVRRGERLCAEPSRSAIATHGNFPAGNYFQSRDIDCARLKIPPKGASLMLLPQLLMTDVADRALRDAGFIARDQPRRVAVLIGTDQDPSVHRFASRLDLIWRLRMGLKAGGVTLAEKDFGNFSQAVVNSLCEPLTIDSATGSIANLVANRLSALWGFNGPSFTLYDGSFSAFAALDLARLMLRFEMVEAVVVGAVDFVSWERILWQQYRSTTAQPGFDRVLSNPGSWFPGEGAGAVVLLPETTAKKKRRRSYALIAGMARQNRTLRNRKNEGEGADSAPPGTDSSRLEAQLMSAVVETAKAALTDAGCDAGEIGFLEVDGSSVPLAHGGEGRALTSIYRNRRSGLPPSFTCVKANLGDTFAAAGLAALIKTALCIYGSQMPTPSEDKPLIHNSLKGLSRPVQTVPWQAEKLRFAAINGVDQDGRCAHVILRETTDNFEPPPALSSDRPPLIKKLLMGPKHIADFTLEQARGGLPDLVPPDFSLRSLPHVPPFPSETQTAQKASEQNPFRSTIIDKEAAPSAKLRPGRSTWVQPLSSPLSAAAFRVKKNELIQQVQTHARQTMGLYLRVQNQITKRLFDLAQGGPPPDRRQDFKTGPETEPIGLNPGRLKPFQTGPQPEPSIRAVRDAGMPDASKLAPMGGAAKMRGKAQVPLWDEAQVLELVTGDPAVVLGPDYTFADPTGPRLRPPAPPFLLVSRVMACDAALGQFRPCSITWEYDIPKESPYAFQGSLTGLVTSETPHALILALIVLGGELLLHPGARFRILDSSTTCLAEPPAAGTTLHGEVRFDSFVKNRGLLLFEYVYRCFERGVCFLENRCKAGVFLEHDLRKVPKRSLRPGLIVPARGSHSADPMPITPKTVFDRGDLDALQRGDFAACFEIPHKPVRAPALAPPRLRALDRIVAVEPGGGRWHHGLIIGEWSVDPNHWVFPIHFPGDPLLPATLIVEGCTQTLLFYLYYLGLHRRFPDFRPNPIPGHAFGAKFRDEVPPRPLPLRYRIHIEVLQLAPLPRLLALIEIVYGDKTIGLLTNYGLNLVPTSETT